MKKRIVFKDSTEDTEISLSTCPDGYNYILAITGNGDDIWLCSQGFRECLDECQRFYDENEKRKNKLPQGEKQEKMTEETKGPYNGYNSLEELESAVDEYFGEYISEQNQKTKEHIENITPQA